MKKILIIADGILAKHFLQRVINIKSGDNSYDVIVYNEGTIPTKSIENFKFYNFDPTSFEKLSPLLKRDYYQIMIIMSKKLDVTITYDNIRKIDTSVPILLLDRWDLHYDDSRLEVLNSLHALSSRFADFLPDMPVIAQNVGLGNGEIMEMRVPIGSSYVYRHLAGIEQKEWRIAGIYRVNSLILPRPTLMIQPNDVLLTIGKPGVLLSVFSSIKKEVGQFPSPFGNSIYIILDMLSMSKSHIDELLNNAFLLHSKINSKKLYIRVVNPTNSEQLIKIKSSVSNNILVEIEYFSNKTKEVMEDDLNQLDIGLIIVNNDFFIQNTRSLFKVKIPVFKIGTWGFSSLKVGIILNSKSEEIEKESSVIFDITTQLNLEIQLYNFSADKMNEKNDLAEHFSNLSKIFGKKVEIINATKNPLLKLQNREDLLQFVPFSAKILDSNFFSIFSTDIEKLYFKLSNSYQIFIPTSI